MPAPWKVPVSMNRRIPMGQYASTFSKVSRSIT
jgi:hypothetical protein